MGILEGKRILVTGVLTESSIAFAAARLAQEQGAEVILSSFGRQMKITTIIAERLPKPARLSNSTQLAKKTWQHCLNALAETSTESCTQSRSHQRTL